MKLITACDAEGNILSIITAPEGGLRPSVPGLPPYQRQVEIDAPDIADDLDDAEIHRRLRDLGNKYKVDSTGKKFVAR
ncbi:hypothetical protein ACLEPN_28550 [Myxococcus sp. 1LA]